jgi:hypothetical protein
MQPEEGTRGPQPKRPHTRRHRHVDRPRAVHVCFRPTRTDRRSKRSVACHTCHSPGCPAVDHGHSRTLQRRDQDRHSRKSDRMSRARTSKLVMRFDSRHPLSFWLVRKNYVGEAREPGRRRELAGTGSRATTSDSSAIDGVQEVLQAVVAVGVVAGVGADLVAGGFGNLGVASGACSFRRAAGDRPHPSSAGEPGAVVQWHVGVSVAPASR